MDWKTQKVLVAGSGKSGIGATDLLKKLLFMMVTISLKKRMF